MKLFGKCLKTKGLVEGGGGSFVLCYASLKMLSLISLYIYDNKRDKKTMKNTRGGEDHNRVLLVYRGSKLLITKHYPTPPAEPYSTAATSDPSTGGPQGPTP